MLRARYQAVSRTDKADNLWLFGGNGDDINLSDGQLNDLWKYNGSTMWLPTNGNG